MNYADLRISTEQYTGLDRDALHAHVALLTNLAGMLLFRVRWHSRIPWFFVLTIELPNQVYDLRRQVLGGEAAALR
jgi:hypothetical protein